MSLSYTAIHATDLIVGKGQSLRGWRNIASWREVEHMNVESDSIFNWNVVPNANLAPGGLDRNGRISGSFIVDDTVTVSGPIVGLEHLIDGDASTAFDPDNASLDQIVVPRILRIRVDLGAVFSIRRIRLFPRLDRDHILSFPQLFRIGTSKPMSSDPEGLLYTTVYKLSFIPTVPNRQPVVDVTFANRDARYIQLAVNSSHPWELAELEIYSGDSVPLSIFTSTVLSGPRAFPVWGKMHYDGGDITPLPITIQTRTGPVPNPIQYFRRIGVGDDLEEVGEIFYYSRLPIEERGSVRPHPEWSNWETVSNGLVRSPPNPNGYLQFRIFFSQAGTVLKNLIFEYAAPPVVADLLAEIDPRWVEPGREETFVLSMKIGMVSAAFSYNHPTFTGFSHLQVLTDARITAIDRVLVDDVEVAFTTRVQNEGFTVNLGRRIDQDGTFLQIVFRGAVFRDGTYFEVRALDRRLVERQFETVYQAAFEADVDPASPGGGLLARFDDRRPGLLVNIAASRSVFTPNGDGANDEWTLSYDLLRLTQAAPVHLDLFDLSGKPVHRLYAGLDASGHYHQRWDGLDAAGRLLPPGTYIYRLRVEGDGRDETRQGLLGIAY